jgi:rod shape-determining protein MreC
VTPRGGELAAGGFAIKPLFLQGPSPATRLLLVTLVSVAMMVADHRGGHLKPLRAGLQAALYPLQLLVDLPVSSAQWLSENLSSRQSLIEENATLRAQQVLLKAQLQKFIALESENRRLRELLDSSFKLGERVLVAELLSVDMDPFARHIVIDKGTLSGVYEGQPLLNADGVVGQVQHLSPLASTAVLITDPSHALPVQVDRTGLHAVVVGSGRADRLSLSYVPNSADIRKGDRLVTSGLGGRFPPGYPVGIVSEVIQDPREPFAQVTVTPSARPDRSRQFLLVWPAANGSDEFSNDE